MSMIDIKNLTFCYDGGFENVFEDVSFRIDTDWRLGFTGRNGRGKTTFLKLLMGKYEYKGDISASVNFEYFPFEAEEKSLPSIEVVSGLIKDFELWRLERELSLLSVRGDALYRPFKTLSGGEQTKILLAALFLKENSFLLVDEPTNHLDAEGRAAVSAYLRSKKGFILVSHDREFLDGCIDHILSINKTGIEIQSGNFSSWHRNKLDKDNNELEKNEKLKKEIKRLADSAGRACSWAAETEKSKKKPLKSGLSADKGYIGHKAAKMMKSSKNIEARQQKAVREKADLLKDIEKADEIELKSLRYRSQRLLELENISISYDGAVVCEGISFAVNAGDRIALVGKNGSGKSSLLKLTAGESVPYSGKLTIGSGLIISAVPQESELLKGGLREYISKNKIDESLFKSVLRKLDFSREQFEKDMESYSAGQKKKVLLAKSLCDRAHLYIWDEPLNFTDILSRIQIEELILKYKPVMLFVEHDAAFVKKVANKFVEL